MINIIPTIFEIINDTTIIIENHVLVPKSALWKKIKNRNIYNENKKINNTSAFLLTIFTPNSLTSYMLYQSIIYVKIGF
jgi:hypothetical protein